VATIEGCPSNGSQTDFAAENPALFAASGWADHPYADGEPPNVKAGATSVAAGFADFSRLSNLATTLDQAAAAWGTDAKLPIYNTEYGNLTKPPSTDPEAVSLSTAAKYLNWTEYLSWRNPRIASYDQYLLEDPQVTKHGSQFFTGLENADGQPKPILYDAFRLPVFLPTTTAKSGQALTVWGCARPVQSTSAKFGRVQIQFSPGTSDFRTVKTVTLHPAGDGCYFDTTAKFSTSGNVRLAYAGAGGTIFSRTQAIRIE
jgi:hypothetical protein